MCKYWNMLGLNPNFYFDSTFSCKVDVIVLLRPQTLAWICQPDTKLDLLIPRLAGPSQVNVKQWMLTGFNTSRALPHVKQCREKNCILTWLPRVADGYLVGGGLSLKLRVMTWCGCHSNFVFICAGPALQPATGDILQPMSSNSQQPTPDDNHKSSQNSNKVPVGATWTNSGNLNIDLDNLLDNKGGKVHTPSMNQLASTPTSPTNQQRAFAVQNQIYASAAATPSPMYAAQNNQFFAAFK